VTKEKYTSEASGSLEEKNKRLQEASEELRKEDEILKELEAKKNQLEEVERAEKNLKQEEELVKHQQEAKNFEQEKTPEPEPNPSPPTQEESSGSLLKEMFQNAENARKEMLQNADNARKEVEEQLEEEKKENPPPPPQVNHVNEGKSQTHQTNSQLKGGLITNFVNRVKHFYYSSILFYYSYNFNRTEAEEARKKHAEQQSKVEPLKSEVELLKKEVGFSIGHPAFFVLKDKCFSVVDKQYTYELCLFSNTHQKSNDGTSTSLGSWDSWDSTGKVMKYINGQSCWNGPSRSTHITVKCGSEEKLSSVDEPSICFYTMNFETPAACNEEDLDQLRKELNMLNGE
jgi:protein kinase C substrate 80K-H